MTPFRRKLLMPKHGSNETLMYSADSITQNVGNGSYTSFAPQLQWVNGTQYHFIFDWEITDISEGTNRRLRFTSQHTEIIFTDARDVSIGSSDHVDAYFTANVTRKRDWLSGRFDNTATGGTVILSNVKVFEVI